MYDLCIVGAGMVGSSAAKYAMQCRVPGRSGRPKVALIGPAEPKDKTTADIFSAHYDEGRITRITDANPAKAVLSKHSVNKYREIERKSGIKFYKECGYLVWGDDERVRKLDVLSGSSFEAVSQDKLQELFPYFKIPDYNTISYHNTEGGTINPRKLVEAQLKLAQEAGCELIRDIVESIDEIDDANLGHYCKLRTAQGGIIQCRKVLLATGTFTLSKRLLPPNMVPDFINVTTFVVKGEVGGRDLEKLKNMPSFAGKYVKTKNSHPCYYGQPPTKYPEGKYYVKIGFNEIHPFREILTTPEQLTQWHRHGSQMHVQEAKMAEQVLRDILPDVDFLSVIPDACACAHTPTKVIYIDMLTSCLGLAVGGSGNAAKDCDETGRIAAKLVLEDTWDSEIPRSAFKCQLKKSSRTSKL